MGERLSKGSQVAITGSLAVNEWEDKEGNKRQTPEVVASQIVMLGGNQTGSTSDEDAPEDDEDIPW
jgi:single-strand DNA-binding protein